MSSGPDPGLDRGSQRADVDRAQEPLSDREIELVKRVFSDPFSIPIEFYAWLKAKLESDPPLFTTASIFGFRSQLAATVAASAPTVPVGSIMDYAGSTDPDVHWLICDGRAVPQATYPVLFGIIAHTYGPDPGGGNFLLPDFRGRVAVGKGTHTDVDALGENDGAALANRRPKHKHAVSFAGGSSPTGDVLAIDSSNLKGGSGSGNVGQGLPLLIGPQSSSPTDAPAYLVVNKVIKVN